MTAADVLRRAAQAYRDGDIRWGRGWYRDPDTGCRCAGGALAFVADTEEDDPTCSPDSDRAMWVLAHYLVDELGAPCMVAYNNEDELILMDVVETVGDWNDDPARTPGEVIAALEAASERAA